MKPWRLLRESTLHRGWRDLKKRVYAMPDGREAEFEIREDGDCVAILALTPEHEIVLTRQYRPGPSLVLLELPGGGIEDGEKPREAAARELKEETGYAGELEFVCDSWENAYSTLHRYNFVARGCVQVAQPKLDLDEHIEVVRMPLDAYRKHLRSGQGTDTESAYLCLDYLGLL